MAQGLQHFFAFVLSNLATAFFSQVTHLCLFRSFLCFYLFWKLYCYYFSTCFDFRKCISVFFEIFLLFVCFFLESDPVLRYILQREGKRSIQRKNMEGLKMDVHVKEREDALLCAYRAGDASAFDGLVELYSAKLYRVAYMLLENKQDAEEVVQDAFVRAYKALPSFRGDSSFETWMHRITLNLARNRFHWNKRRGMGLHISLSTPQLSDLDQSGPVQDMDLPDVTMQPDQELATHELENDIDSIINALPEKFRESLLLRHQKEMSYEAIAQATGVPINTVKTRIKRARELLKEGLAQREYDSRKKYRFRIKT